MGTTIREWARGDEWMVQRDTLTAGEVRAILNEVIAEVKRLPGAGGAQSLLWLEDVLALLRRMKEEPNA